MLVQQELLMGIRPRQIEVSDSLVVALGFCMSSRLASGCMARGHVRWFQMVVGLASECELPVL